ncbi:ComEA family DNA-binding protein [Actinomadura xylanilytica]|uniref:ComEA family DNA-binding protein n=1 Tax=Actinomadura xylanilytica TaxID=887459 RepID=UPI00255ABF32|nr:ComEA family DNA-binding protein [Actinomadura xylanilytica]MDL4771410.1 ComEA family DNA-binding protein [Actinomadura xylanilytica]
MRFTQRHDIGADRLRPLMDRLSGRPRPPGPLDGGTADDPTPPMARLRSGPEPPGIEIPRSRFDPGWSGARALMLVAVIAAVVAVGYLWLARPRPQPVAPVAMTASPMVSLSPAASLRASTSPAASQAGGTVVVHVLGKVRHPGVISLPGGARVAEAIKAAGGVRPGTGTGSLNLARKVVDGEQIPVGIRPPPGTVQPPGAGAGAASAGPGAAAGTPVDLNNASAAQLDQLPGVGPVLAQRIVDYRTQHGAFRSVDQLQEVSGIGSRRFADLKSMVRV